MDFDLNDDQRSLQQVLREVLDDRVNAAAYAAGNGAGWDEELWDMLAVDLGVVGLMIPESWGGLGAGLIEVVVVQEALGERLAAVPYLAVSLGAEAMLACARREQREAWLPGIVTGQRRPVLALAEGRHTWCVDRTSVTAIEVCGGWQLSGVKDHVLALEAASEFLVPAITDQGIGLFRVEDGTAGLEKRPGENIDPGRPTGSLSMSGASGELVGEISGVAESLQRVHLLASLLLAAESVGGMQRCLDLATEHASTRVQFGRPIGGFQAIKHRCANMYVDFEGARALTRYAAWSMEVSEPSNPLNVRLSHAVAVDAYYRVARENIQIQGGIGFTWEHEAHWFLKRAITSRYLFGGPEEVREDSARLLGLLSVPGGSLPA